MPRICIEGVVFSDTESGWRCRVGRPGLKPAGGPRRADARAYRPDSANRTRYESVREARHAERALRPAPGSRRARSACRGPWEPTLTPGPAAAIHLATLRRSVEHSHASA